MMDQELRDYLDQRFDDTSRQIQELRQETMAKFEQVDQRFEQVDQRFEQVDDQIRQVHIVVEDLRGQIQAVAEGVVGVDEKLERFRQEQKQEFEDVRAMTRLSYTQLERRVTVLEDRADQFDTRIHALETAQS